MEHYDSNAASFLLSVFSPDSTEEKYYRAYISDVFEAYAQFANVITDDVSNSLDISNGEALMDELRNAIVSILPETGQQTKYAYHKLSEPLKEALARIADLFNNDGSREWVEANRDELRRLCKVTEHIIFIQQDEITYLESRCECVRLASSELSRALEETSDSPAQWRIVRAAQSLSFSLRMIANLKLEKRSADAMDTIITSLGHLGL
ncbi:hypothetical protein [Bifidobacterium tibiigranuli]|jgi:hypothetical protein|uniref:hypothetical protein n=1 Tax=Bifidobacterium tibiigranuli TaxID=2172043 RepID=UPI0023539A6B|nr:hypothetical protein [Bifidobacterium tibiigranuli]MCI1212222.1 hypothetical protein [Bifidobacterium tibiigranuli]MCI1222097.1 hypothetical protein [Bifidobacterium tibiigranuli]